MEAFKKTISININGIIFHVEEDGFELLKNYLSAISKNFASYSNSAELMTDIEGRIAEFLLERIEYPKEYISLLDVEDLIAVMGTVSDFDPSDYKHTHQSAHQAAFAPKETQPKRLYRDTQRKLIAGVASGIAHYFSIDPLWIRLLFLLVFFDMPSFFAVSGVIAMLYGLMWMVMPGNDQLEENSNVRQLFRDLDGRVVGGVASGLAAYLNVDPTLVRVGFVLSILLGGIGILSYIILWIITPAANSITERMRMTGEPITLENIENRIREQLRFDNREQEEAWVRALMLPFRMGASVLEYAEQRLEGKNIGGMAFSLVALLAGGSITLMATAMSVAMLTVFGLFVGTANINGMVNVEDIGIPLQLIRNTVPTATVGFGLLAAWVPVAFMGVAGITIAARRVVTPRLLHGALLALFGVGVIGSAITMPMLYSNFQSEGVNKQEFTFAPPAAPNQPLLLHLAKTEGGIENVRLTIKGHDKPEVLLEQKSLSKGSSRQDAIMHAANVKYDFVNSNGSFTFPDAYQLADGVPFRNQEVAITLYVPYGQEFIMPKELRGILRNTLTPHGYGVRDMGDQVRWVYDENGLKCLNCNEQREKSRGFASSTFVEDFNQIEVGENCQLLIIQGEEQKISVEGISEGETPFGFQVEDGVLHISQEDRIRGSKIVIQVPALQKLILEGSADAVMEGMRLDELELQVTDGASCTAELFVGHLKIHAEDGAKILLKGKGDELSIEAQDGARVDAREYIAAILKANGEDGARLKLGKAENCQVQANDNCHVERDED